MPPDSRFEHLRSLAAGEAPSIDGTTLPPEAYEAWRAAGARFGKFVILGELGRGGTSVVYRAWQADLRREVALKVVSGLNPELRERFLREGRVGARLAHPAILPVHEAGEDAGGLWLSMPLVRGKTLDECGLEAAEAARAVAAAARGVAAAHAAGVIHRDLKPRNIMRTGDGGVVVMDFGLALTREEVTRISVTGQVLGTPQYMAPEQALGRPADARTDVYGLGATLYRILAGQAPYPASTLQAFLTSIAGEDPTPPSRLAAVPAPLEAVVLKAMERDPSRRYATADALADDLELFVAGGRVAARLPGPLARAWRLARRRRHVAVPLALGLVALSAWGTAVTVGRLRTGHTPGPQTDPEPPPDGIAAAHALARDGQWDLALAAYADILQADPRRADALLGSAECRMARREWARAAAEYGRYLELRPRDARAWNRWGEAYMNGGNLDAARAGADQALTFDPTLTDALYLRSEIHFRKGEMDAAVADQNEALKANPDHPEGRMRRAEMLARVGRAAEALPDIEFALQKGGRQPAWLLARGRAKRAGGDLQGALADFLEAMAADPNLVATAGPEAAIVQEEMKNAPR